MDALADLHAAGMTSHATVNVMLGLEDAFDIEFPEKMLRKSTFGTISAISDAVAQLRAGAQ
jgi:acyl carrier protein